MTLDEALALYREWLSTLNYSPASRKTYRERLAFFRAWLGARGVDEIRSIRKVDVQDYQAHMARMKLSRDTRAARFRVAKQWLDWLVRTGHLFQSPAQGIAEPAPVARKLPVVPTTREVTKLLEQPNTSTWSGIRDRALFELLYSAGIRRSECHALDLSDIDLTRGLVSIQRGKGGKGRVVPFGKEAGKWLAEYIRDIRPQYHRKNPSERALFLDRFGHRLLGKDMYAALRRCAVRAGIRKRLYLHSLRHAFATHMIVRGADIVAIQRLLGHASLKVTSHVYTRVFPKDLKEEHMRTHPAELDLEKP